MKCLLGIKTLCNKHCLNSATPLSSTADEDTTLTSVNLVFSKIFKNLIFILKYCVRLYTLFLKFMLK